MNQNTKSLFVFYAKHNHKVGGHQTEHDHNAKSETTSFRENSIEKKPKEELVYIPKVQALCTLKCFSCQRIVFDFLRILV